MEYDHNYNYHNEREGRGQAIGAIIKSVLFIGIVLGAAFVSQQPYVKDLQIGERFKAGLADALKFFKKGADKNPQSVRVAVAKKIETQKASPEEKTATEAWINAHKDFENPAIGHKALEILEEKGLKAGPETLQAVYEEAKTYAKANAEVNSGGGLIDALPAISPSAIAKDIAQKTTARIEEGKATIADSVKQYLNEKFIQTFCPKPDTQ